MLNNAKYIREMEERKLKSLVHNDLWEGIPSHQFPVLTAIGL
jgi:hypothetical protein